MNFAGITIVIYGVFTFSTSGAVEVNLTDTRLATTDLNWDTYPSDGNGWTEASNMDENGEPLRTFQVCGIRIPGQNNWFRTNYIELKENAKNVFVEIKFTIRACHDITHVATCKETFNLYFLDAKSPHSGREKFMNERVYKKVDTIATNDRFPVDSHVTNTETREIGPITGNGIYIAFQDTGACMLIYYIRVYYKKCDNTVTNLARFESTVTGPKVTSLVKVTGICVANSIWTENLNGPTMRCNGEGKWKVPDGECQCLPGYEPNADKTECLECSAGQYKANIGNGRCRTCPDNSVSIKRASVKCICSAGYYKSLKDNVDSPCTKSPTEPVQVIYSVNKTSVDIKWSLPKYTGGRKDITYSIRCLRCDSSYSLCSECGDNVEYEPRQKYLSRRHVIVKQLSAHTNYRFRIFSYNGVTKISGKEPRYAEIMLETSEAPPSSVASVRVIEEGKSEVLLNWDLPRKPNGVILEYQIEYTSDGRNGHVIKRQNHTKSQTFRIRHLPKATSFFVQVRARNAAGYGLFSNPVGFKTRGIHHGNGHNTNVNIDGDPLDPTDLSDPTPTVPAKQKTDSAHLVVGIAVASVLIIILVAALLVVTRIRRKRRIPKSPLEVYPFFDSAIDLIQAHRSTRSYIDPSTYGDPYKAVHEFAKEIDSFNVKKEELLGSGEFGDVYKGLLRPVTPICDDSTLRTTATLRTMNYIVAIKTLKTGYTEKQKQDFLTEASIMGQFDHPNVIRLEGVVTKSAPFMIVTEYMENGSLDSFLEDRHIRGVELESYQLINMLRDISDGMLYLSDMGYVHRDLAARNILVNDQLVCKVSDFGLSRILENIQDEDTAIYTTKGGMIPIRWTSPEAITMRTFTSSSDVWSFGVVMWEVLTHGERPYWEMPNADVVHCVQCGYRLPPPTYCPRVLHNLMLNCWNVDRTRRPTFKQIVSQLDAILLSPDRLQDTINNIPVHEQPECIPESLDLSSLGQWLEDMNMTQYKETMMRFGCVTAEQITRLSPSHLEEMGITDISIQQMLLIGAERLGNMLQEISNNRGITV